MPVTDGTLGNVSPGIGGKISYAEYTSSLTQPTTASAALTGFTSLGYISEDGVKENIGNTVEFINFWGKRNAKPVISETEHTVTFTLVEARNADVRKLVYGDKNASVTTAALSGEITSPTAYSFVIDMVMDDGDAKRLVIPVGYVTEIGEITYNDTEAIGYEITVTATMDSSGKTIYDYGVE